MKKLKKTLVLTVAAASLLGVGALTSTNASASFAQPHPKYLDYWYYGTNSNGWAYSEYYLSAPVRLGSSSSVTDIWGNGSQVQRLIMVMLILELISKSGGYEQMLITVGIISKKG